MSNGDSESSRGCLWGAEGTRVVESGTKFNDLDLIERFLQVVSERDWQTNLDQFVLTSLRRLGVDEILPALHRLLAFDPPPRTKPIRRESPDFAGFFVRNPPFAMRLPSLLICPRATQMRNLWGTCC
jgi:hypothetical protein